MKKKSSTGKRATKRGTKDLTPRTASRVKGGGKAQGGPILAGWDVKANQKA